MPSLQLSALDQSAPRSYIRYALVFACEPVAAAAVASRLHRAVAKTVSELPVLAGTVKAEEGAALEVSTSVAQIARSAPALTSPQDGSLALRALVAESVPAGRLFGTTLTPLPDAAEHGTNPVFAVQANFVQDGLILVLYLHRSVADINGIRSAVRAMCEDLPTRRQTEKELAEELKAASLSRSRLATGAGAPAFLAQARQIYQQQHQRSQQAQMPATATNTPAQATRAAIISFSIPKLTTITDCINIRRQTRRSSSREPLFSPRDILFALLWRMATRARLPSTSASPLGATTSISFPIDVRATVAPPLEHDFLGNATVTAFANHDVDLLGMYYDISTIERTATILAAARASAATDVLVRAEVAMLAEQKEGAALVANEADLKIVDWSESLPLLEFNELDLGLGLGEPICVRKVGRVVEKNEVVVLPPHELDWEVQLGLEEDVLVRISEDEQLRHLVQFYQV